MGGLPGQVPVIFETFIKFTLEKKESPGGFKTSAKEMSRWVQKRSAGPLIYIQLSKSDYKRLLHEPYVNEVTLIGQNPLLNCC